MLPMAHQSGRVGPLEALFTSTSAVCVTGLIVVDTATDFTRFGQVVILVLIQVGGLGIMTFAALTFLLVGARLPMSSLALVSDAFFQRDVAVEFHHAFRTILILTVVAEAGGAILLFIFAPSEGSLAASLFSAVFHSVSAFCNAGFSLRSNNLMGWRHNLPALFTVMGLVVTGGLGYAVLREIWAHFSAAVRLGRARPRRRVSTHTKLVLWLSFGLVFGGAIMLLAFGAVDVERGFTDKVVSALFHSVSARTAGFNTSDLSLFPPASLVAVIILMFIGGSPGSCAGGTKTTTIAVWLARMRASLHGAAEVKLMGRSLSVSLVSRADLVVGLAIFWNIIGVLLLLNTEAWVGEHPLHVVFEQFSAFGTVGLSTGLTGEMSVIGKLWLCATMFVGRVGPLTAALWIFPPEETLVRYPQTNLMIG